MGRNFLLGMILVIACSACNKSKVHPVNTPSGVEIGSEELGDLARRSIIDGARLQPDNFRRIVILNPPLVVPTFSGDGSLPSEFQPFYAVPTKEGEGFRLGTTNYAMLLRQTINNIELGVIPPTHEQLAAVDKAKRLLYDDAESGKPSQVYERYLNFEKEHAALAARLQLANGDDSHALQNKLKANDDEWKLLGNRAEVAKSLALLAINDGSELKGQLNDWRAVVNASARPSGKEIWSALKNPNMRFEATVPLPEMPGVLMTARAKKANQSWTNVKIGGVKRITFACGLAKISHPALEHAFVSLKSWRFADVSKSRVISTGDPSSTKENELVPWVPSGIVFVKSMEVTFADSTQTEALAALIKDNEMVELAGARFLSGHAEHGDTHSLTVTIADSWIVAVVIERQPKSPDPDDKLRWPNGTP